MVKKKEKKTATGSLKKTKSAKVGTSSKEPQRSGAVKGPMGVGDHKKSGERSEKPILGTSRKQKKETPESELQETKKKAKHRNPVIEPFSEAQKQGSEKNRTSKKGYSEVRNPGSKKKISKAKPPFFDTRNLEKQASEEKNKEARKEGKTRKPHQKNSEAPLVDSLITPYDVHLFKEGKHFHLYKKLGSHLMERAEEKGVFFAVWAPNAKEVSVIGDFNEWNKDKNSMIARNDESGIWEVFIPEAKNGSIYKYFIRGNSGYEVEKGDPYAFLWENPPNTASVVWDLEHSWNDQEWLKQRKKEVGKAKPVSVYELHIGSWKRVPEENNRSLTYLEMAEQLPDYIQKMGFTHVEFMPVMEHPFYGSWGYQITGYFAPSSRFGTPQDFMQLIDSLHQKGIGVILDWVPSHFPGDLHGLHHFDGTFLYEHADPKKGFHPDWQSYIFNYGRKEVRSFLISNALFWLDKFHADGLRVDAVASMLYLDYSRREGEWTPNKYGGRENLEAISFLKEFNEVVYGEFPDIMTIAEESTAWPMVSKPTYIGGLGFGMKWMMGWMHDTLEYFKKDPIHRKHHQNMITFSTVYAFSENFMLPLSHDEVVYGKRSLINKMPGDLWNKFANLRSLYAYMFAHSGTKLLFMGGEFGQASEWDHDSSLDWHYLQEPLHQQLQETLKKLNSLYKEETALYEKEFDASGFEWIDINDEENSVISFLRKGTKKEDSILIVCNFTPMVRENYRIGVSDKGNWKEIFNSDASEFGGSTHRNLDEIYSEEIPIHNRQYSIALGLPPMSVMYLKVT